jgi:peptidoglycan/LPS O-acetylase OafA/YrhL
MHLESQPRVRTDIQALRAVAVTSAVLFHAKIPGMPGGFYGVDVFFVISGFLITGLLCRELSASNRIDLLAFWTRRAWRLLPNAFAVLALCLVLSATIGRVADQRSSTVDVIAAVLYLANYRFVMRAEDYFDDTTATSPVLHFWSLSVEEQFYIAWPLLLLAFWPKAQTKAARSGYARLTVLVSVVILISSMLAIYWGGRSHPDAFFRTETRAWQLAVGALMAITCRNLAFPLQWRTPAFLGGCLGLAVSIAGLHERLATPFPVLSTVLIIIAYDARPGRIYQLVSQWPLQWLGARSYSIYLWHWPILLFGRQLIGESIASTMVLLSIVLLVSALAYRYIECPLRSPSWAMSALPRRVGLPLIATSLICAAAAGFLHFKTISGGERAEVAARITAGGQMIPIQHACSAIRAPDVLSSR